MGANEKHAATWNGSSEAEAGRQAMSNNHDLFPYDGHLERHADEQAAGNDKGAFPYAYTITYAQQDQAIAAATTELLKQARSYPESGYGLLQDVIPGEAADAAVRVAIETLGIAVTR